MTTLFSVHQKSRRRWSLHRRRKFLFYLPFFLIFRRKALASTFIEFYNTVKTRAPNNLLKAECVRTAALKLQQELTKFKCNEVVTYYVHSAVHHLPEQIKCCVVDIVDASGSAIELANKSVRRGLQLRCFIDD